MIKTAQPALHGVQHLPDGSDPIPGLPDARGGDDVSGLILATGPAGFWKLNETSGSTAADSSGNGHDMNPPSGKSPPTWGQAVAPPGETSAKWVDNGTRERVSMTAFTDNFTAGIWANVPAASATLMNELLGQGASIHGTGTVGWELLIQTGSAIYASFRSGGASALILSDAAPTTDTWYFIALVCDGGVGKLYVNGILQAATPTSPVASASDTWIGNDDFPSHTFYAHNVLLSYAFISPTVLHSTELLEIYNAAFSGGAVPAHKVWTALGDGTAAWDDARMLVEF